MGRGTPLAGGHNERASRVREAFGRLGAVA